MTKRELIEHLEDSDISDDTLIQGYDPALREYVDLQEEHITFLTTKDGVEVISIDL